MIIMLVQNMNKVSVNNKLIILLRFIFEKNLYFVVKIEKFN